MLQAACQYSNNTQHEQWAMTSPGNIQFWKFPVYSSSLICILAQPVTIAIKSQASYNILVSAFFFSTSPQQILEVPGHILVKVARSQCTRFTIHRSSLLPKSVVLLLKTSPHSPSKFVYVDLIARIFRAVPFHIGLCTRWMDHEQGSNHSTNKQKPT